MIDLLSLISIASAFFVVAASPGPANISNATIAMTYGRKVSFIYGFGLSSGLLFWGLVAASGMGVVLQSSIYILMVLKVIGGIYLLWLAFITARSALNSKEKSGVPINNGNWFIKGLLLNISNPKSVIAWMAALAIGLDPNDNIVSVVMAVSTCVLVGIIVNASYTLLFSMEGMMIGYQRFKRWISGAVAALFTFAGLGLIRSAFSK